MARVVIGPQVKAFCQTLAPEPRSRVKRALAELARGRGDIAALEKNLEGLYRLRVGRFRIIHYYAGGDIRCFYIAPRDLVYDVLSSRLTERFNRGG
jgi:mRNA-degrading endonuclease RelE of RelBE toxin-antitoxin system